MNKLFIFNWDCGRDGELESLFIATQEEVDAAIGKELFFGEVLGKHSEVYGTLESDDVNEIDVGEAVVAALLEKMGASVCGYNPLMYISEDDEDEDDEDDEDE